MDQQTQQQPPVQAPQQPAQQMPAGQATPKKSSKVWLWVIGGCLAIVIITGLVMGGLAWWGARKVRKAIQENQPKWEEMQKGAEDAQEQWKEQMEKMQEQMPTAPSQ